MFSVTLQARRDYHILPRFFSFCLFRRLEYGVRSEYGHHDDAASVADIVSDISPFFSRRTADIIIQISKPLDFIYVHVLLKIPKYIICRCHLRIEIVGVRKGVLTVTSRSELTPASEHILTAQLPIGYVS